MNQNIGTKQFFTVLFWANPKSGFDVAKKNIIMGIFRDALVNIDHPDQVSPERFKVFEEKNEGMVIYEEVIETDVEEPSIESDVMPVIKSKYPSARYIAMIPIG